MLRNKFVLVICLFFVSNLIAQPKNLVLGVIDGVSRSTVYPLIQKNKLASISNIISDGNYRNLNIVDSETYSSVYQSILDKSDLNSGSLFEKIKSLDPSITIGVIFSLPKDLADQDGLFLPMIAEADILETIAYREPIQVEQAIRRVADQLSPPYVLFVNFPSPLAKGKQYREGAERYSLALQRVDRSIGRMVTLLKSKDLAINTEYLFAGSTCFEPYTRTEKGCSKSLIFGSQKIRQLGSQFDIQDTALDLMAFDIEQTRSLLR